MILDPLLSIYFSLHVSHYYFKGSQLGDVLTRYLQVMDKHLDWVVEK